MNRKPSRLRSLAPRVGMIDIRRIKPLPKTRAEFYGTPEWRTLIAAVIAERGRRCEDCGRTGCRVFGDHVVELQDGGAPLERRNVRLRCGSCHTTKTTAERARRAAAPAV